MDKRSGQIIVARVNMTTTFQPLYEDVPVNKMFIRADGATVYLSGVGGAINTAFPLTTGQFIESNLKSPGLLWGRIESGTGTVSIWMEIA